MKKTKLECGKILLVSICSLQERKKSSDLKTCIFFKEKLKWNILFLSRYQDLHLFLLFLCLSPFLPVITSFSVLEGMILTLFDPPRIFTPTKLNFSILRCFTSSFRTEGSNTTWKPFILSQISTYKRTWNDLILWSFTDFIPDAFHFIDSPKTSISYCISAPLCSMIIYNQQNYKTS